MYGKLSLDSMEICPQFTTFNFTGWDKDSQVNSVTYDCIWKHILYYILFGHKMMLCK